MREVSQGSSSLRHRLTFSLTDLSRICKVIHDRTTQAYTANVPQSMVRFLTAHCPLSPLTPSPNRAIAAYTSLAGMVIATEYLHGSNSAPVNLRLRGEVLEIIDLLERERTLGNVMTTRGVNLLRVMIGDSPSESNVGGQVEEENAPAAASPIWAGLDLPALEELWPADGFGIDGGDAMWWNGNGNGNGTSGSGVGGSDWLATSFGGDGSGWPEF